MSFKDKPLKKIVADKRVTIDAIHSDIVKDHRLRKKEYEEIKKNITKLKVEDEKNSEIKILEKKIKEYDKTNEINYYLDTGLLLNDYYSKKNGSIKEENKEMSVLDFMNIKKVINNPQQEDLINKYMSKVDEDIVLDDMEHNIYICKFCNISLSLKNIDSLLICRKCGFT